MTALIHYSTFANVTDASAVAISESWDVLAQRLTSHNITPNKADVGLWNGTTFGGSGRRKLSTAIDTYLLIIDFDNQLQKGQPGYDKDVKKCVQQPASLYEIEAILRAIGVEFAMATSHSHTPDWPRFRVVLPLAAPVPVSLWKPFAAQAMNDLGLISYAQSIDPIYSNPAQPYYWPSSPPDARERYAIHVPGYRLAYNPARMPIEAQYAARQAQGGTHDGVSPFSEEQVAIFWAYELPEMEQHHDGMEWKWKCEIHGGANTANFCIEPKTGKWYCFSECKEGGDLYRYVQRKYNKTFPEAKKYVHDITGDSKTEYTPEQLSKAIPQSDAADVPSIVAAIAQQPKKQQAPLIEQLVTTHQVDPEVIKEQIEESRSNVVKFERKGEQASIAPTAPDQYGLMLEPDRYQIDNLGRIFSARWETRGNKGQVLALSEKPLCERTLWPALMGYCLATEQHFILLNWYTSNKSLISDWVPEDALRDKTTLMKLADVPISLVSVGLVSEWLTYAKTHMSTDQLDVTTKSGWVPYDNKHLFVLDDDPHVKFIGDPQTVRGSVEGWSTGLQAILGMGVEGYRALVVLGLAAGSPLVRFTHKRNPVLSLVAPSSTGKNKVIEYGLSIWDDHSKMRFAVGSTTKGIQDGGMRSPDIPVFADEAQQIAKRDPLQLENMLYWAGDGQQRVTSTPGQRTQGGGRRYGVCFLASEYDITPAIQEGAQNRVIVLDGPPLRPGDLRSVNAIESATTKHCGVVGRALAAHYNENQFECIAEAEYEAQALSQQGNLRGDDANAIAIMAQGLRALEAVTGMRIPVAEVTAWLVSALSVHRVNTKDTTEDTFVFLLEALMSMPWDQPGAEKGVLMDADGGIAWRKAQASDPDIAPLEVNPTHPKVRELLRSRGQSDRIAAQWAKRGWLSASGANVKRARSNKAGFNAGGAYTWRITLQGLSRVGLDAEFKNN